MNTNAHALQEHDFWQTHVLQWQESGLTQAAYCRQQALSAHNFSYHKRKLAGTSDTATDASGGFANVRLAASVQPHQGTLVLHLGNGVSLSGITTHNLALVKQLAGVLS